MTEINRLSLWTPQVLYLYNNIYWDKNERLNHSTLLSLLKENNVDRPEAVERWIRSSIERSIKETVNELSDIQYFQMEKSGYWGEYGREKVVFGYARLKSCVNPEHDLTQYNLDSFFDLMDSRTDLAQMSLEELKETEKSLSFEIMGRQIDIHRDDLINAELRFLGSKKRINIAMDHEYRTIVYGIAQEKRIENHLVNYFDKEIARTPSVIMSVAATIGINDIKIRRESSRMIFQSKWRRMFEYSDREKRCLLNNETGNIGEMLKQTALNAYNIGRLEDIDRIRDTFIDEMLDGILWHELGHANFYYHELSPEQHPQVKAFGKFGDNIIDTLNEIIADWSQSTGEAKSPIHQFLTIASSDPKRATRMLWVYMSDYWFAEHTEGKLGALTDFTISLLCPFIRSDLTFDFAALEARYQEIHVFLLRHCTRVIEDVVHIAKQATYTIDGTSYDFEYIDKSIKEFLDKDEKNLSDHDSVLYRVLYWWNVFHWKMKNHAKDKYDYIVCLLKAEQIKIKSELLALLGAPQYGSNLRAFMFDQLKAKGLYKPVNPISAREAIEMAADQTSIISESKKELMVRFDAILLGETTIKAEIDHKCKFDILNCVLQEMLCSNPKADLNGETIISNDVSSALKEKPGVMRNEARNKLRNLAKMLDDKILSDITVLKVNTDLLKPENWNELIQETTLSSGNPLNWYIGRILGESMKTNCLLSFQSSMQSGYLCYNTVNAICRINAHLKMPEMKRNVIDRRFLDFIALEYVNSFGSQATKPDSITPTGQHSMILAAKCGRVDFAQLFLDHGADPEPVDTSDWTPLMHAASKGHLEIAKFLLGREADIEHRNSYGATPLSIAASYNQCSAVKFLIDNGADTTARDTDDWDALIYAAQSGCTENASYLIEKGFDVDCCDKNFWTPLMRAVSRGHIDTARMLLENGADIEHRNSSGDTPLLIAAANNHLETTRFLLEKGANKDAYDNQKFGVLIHAARNGCTDTVSFLISAGFDIEKADNKGWTSLMYAAQNGHTEICEKLIREHAKIEAQSNTGITALMTAASNGHDKTASLLLEHGALVDARDATGWTALMFACANGALSTIEVLLKDHAQIDIRDQDGWTPLMHAASSGYCEAVELLVKKGASRSSLNYLGSTAAVLAAQNGHFDCMIDMLGTHADLKKAGDRFHQTLRINGINIHELCCYYTQKKVKLGLDALACDIADLEQMIDSKERVPEFFGIWILNFLYLYYVERKDYHKCFLYNARLAECLVPPSNASDRNRISFHARYVSSASWYACLIAERSKALELSEFAINTIPENVNARLNRAHAFMINNFEKQALEIHKQDLHKTNSYGRSWVEVAKEDFAELRKRGMEFGVMRVVEGMFAKDL
jgi:ankyrin repeat protein